MNHMGMLDSFRALNEAHSFEDVNESYHQQPVAEFDRGQSDPNAWLDRYAKFTTRPGFNPNMDGYFTAYTGHWGGYSDVMQGLSGMDLGPLQEKVEPNKIFTADIAALKTLAADQGKLVKVFERKVLESLNDKGKFGVNEDDIEAIQALTAARNSLMSIQKEQIGVKKSIAELKIKQQQANAAGGSAGAPGTTGRPASAFDVGRSIMDRIFDNPVPTQPQEPAVNANYPTVDLDHAASVLDSIVGADTVPDTIAYEADDPKTYVVVGESDTDTEFVTFSASGEVLPDYPNPTTKIQSVDREAGKAVDELLVSYPIKTRDEIG
jgi:hypothetical protein